MDYKKQYAEWREALKDDASAASELAGIAGDEKEIEERFYRELSFGTAGMRGLIGLGTNRMNIYTVRRATLGLARFIAESPELKAGGVAIGYDSRHCSDIFALETALVLAGSGIKAYLFPSLRPVPMLSFALRYLKTGAGVVITASHNPKQYNGYKVYGEDGGQIAPDTAETIIQEIDKIGYFEARPMDENEARAKNLLVTIGPEVDDAYYKEVESLAIAPEILRAQGKDLKIVYTPLHGSGNIPVRRVLHDMGIENLSVVQEQELPDPDFSTVKVPNPEDRGAFDIARRYMEESGADVAFGTDPDCDRIGVALREKNGEILFLTGNQIGCLLLDYILKNRKEQGTLPKNGAAVKSIVSTRMADKICAHYDIAMMAVLTGFKFIAEKIQEFQETGSHVFLFGFEESFGYLSGTEVRDKDAVNASLLIAEAACYYRAQNKTLRDALEGIYQTYGYYLENTVSFSMPGKDGQEKMNALMAHIRENPPKSLSGKAITRLYDYKKGIIYEGRNETPTNMPASDVLYYALEDECWCCIRPSGTEPKIKVYMGSYDGKDENAAKKLLDALGGSMKQLMEGDNG